MRREEEPVSGDERPRRWERPLDPEDDGEAWDDRDDERPLSQERRRHRDQEETDERLESERRQHPRRRDGHRE